MWRLDLTFTCEPSESAVATFTEWLWVFEAVQATEALYQGPMGQQTVVGLRILGQAPSGADGDTNGDAGSVAPLIGALEARLTEPEDLWNPHYTLSEWVQVKPEDWEESWKQYWHASRITDTLVVCPTWESFTPATTDRVLYLDPGGAFGTGTHATTRLMLAALERLSDERDLSQTSVLDVGCGSGILSIAAAMFRCGSVMALDIEQAALAATELNARQNKVESAITVAFTPIDELCLTPYDVILANIHAPIILSLLDAMVQRLVPGGVMLLSGLIETSVGTVTQALEAAGCNAIESHQQGDWFLLKATGP